MTLPQLNKLSRRERQIMDVLIEHGACSAQQVQESIPEPPSYSAVRALIARLVDKNFVSFERQGTKYIYSPNISAKRAQGSALNRLIKTFFKGSSSKALNALLDMEDLEMSEREIEEIERKIHRLKEKK